MFGACWKSIYLQNKNHSIMAFDSGMDLNDWLEMKAKSFSKHCSQHQRVFTEIFFGLNVESAVLGTSAARSVGSGPKSINKKCLVKKLWLS